MSTQTVPAPQRIWEIGTVSTDPHRPARGTAASRVMAVAAIAFAVSGAVGGRLTDGSGGGGDVAASVSRTVAVVAAAVALTGGFVVLARAVRRLRRRTARWAGVVVERRVVAFLDSSLRTRG